MRNQTISFSGVTQRFGILLIILYSCFLNNVFAAKAWQSIAPGIDYWRLDRPFVTPWSRIHVFRIDLKKNKLSLMMATDFSKKSAVVDDFLKHAHGLIAINGGFFDGNDKPLGLRVDNKQQKSPLKRISWWGIFYIKNQRAYITNLAHYRPNPDIDFAVQSGPRLLNNHRFYSLKGGKAERSALGITEDGRVLIVVTDNLPLSTTELAHIMEAKPLNCKKALNLDGGSSSQLRAQLQGFRLKVHGFSHVSDAIVVKPRH